MSSFEWFVCLRYLRAKRQQKFISLITVISVLGVAVGVLALIVVLSVYTGFTKGLRDQIIGINAHVIVQTYGGTLQEVEKATAIIENVDDVIATTPYVYGQALITSGAHSTGIVLRGIEPESAVNVITVEQTMKQGSLLDLEKDIGVSPVVLGIELAKRLRVGVGDRIRLISPNGPLSPMGVLPKIKTCVLVGIFETGMYEYDSTIGYTNLTTARALAGLVDGVHGIEVKVGNIDRADKAAEAVATALGPGYSVRDWMHINQNLFAALKLEKAGIFIALDLIILVAALNIISALIMVVMEKTRDIAILKSMGATTKSIMKIFFYQGMIIGLTGTFLGVISGLSICWVLKKYKFIELPSNVYPMSTMPITVVPLDIIIIAISALVITLLATLYPSWKASKVKPAEALTYE